MLKQVVQKRHFQRADVKKKGGGGLLSISQRPVYHLPFVLIFGVLSEGKKNCSDWSKVKDISTITYFLFY